MIGKESSSKDMPAIDLDPLKEFTKASFLKTVGEVSASDLSIGAE